MIGAYPFRVGDELRVSVRASVTTAVVLFARVRYVDGTDDLIEIPITHSAGDRTNEVKRSPDLFKKAGWVEHLTVDTILNDARGRFYMMVAINKKPHHFPIAAGYIDIPHVPLGYFEAPRSGRGSVRVISLGDPAAGADYAAEEVPVGAMWKLRGFSGQFVADGTGANRFPQIRITDGTDVYAGGACDDVITASETRRVVGIHGVVGTTGGAGLDMMIGLPEVLMLPGHEFTVVTGNIVAGDNWGEGFIEVEEWIAP